MDVMLYEFKHDLNAYLSSADQTRRAFAQGSDRVQPGIRHKELAYFGQDLFLSAEKKGRSPTRHIRTRLRRIIRLTRVEGIDASWKSTVSTPGCATAGPSWLIDLVDGDHDTGGTSSLAAVAGYPNINVPAGLSWACPWGFHSLPAWSEPTLIKIAYALSKPPATHSAGFLPRQSEASARNLPQGLTQMAYFAGC